MSLPRAIEQYRFFPESYLKKKVVFLDIMLRIQHHSHQVKKGSILCNKKN